ncbi:hypothetical protein PHLGIDRAFT_238213 [Phlebiopsis gigantea 11061_1 CR5-6]|uniref:Uncharacterized protein n=1 Tax=Phlebiopsis gigantea (strain 11061_1 CR5-6) TaxID=745531 RepID=A0A0C3S5C5_PHLG1|nr:hypothetical protein PHLGIDRAFT_238213 [Phlebiopsis gigantea 11061_1 CR5-6]
MDEFLLADDFKDSEPNKAPTIAQHADSSRRISRKSQVVACLLLHFTLVVLHILLLVIWSHHYEHNATFNISTFSTQWLPVIVTAFSQLVGAVYLSFLLLFTQRLALRASFGTPQTLTAIHDQSNAWQGLGSAIVAAYQQLKVPAATARVASILMYLIGVFALHVSIPSMLHAENFEDISPKTVSTTLANSSFQGIFPNMFEFLPVYGQFPTLGLLDNMVYDIIPSVASAVGTTAVNASIYSVECMAIPTAKQSEAFIGFMQSGTNVTQYAFQLDEGNQAAVTLPYYPAVWTSQNVTLTGTDCDPTLFECVYPIIVSSTVPVVDASGTRPAGTDWTSIQPQVAQADLSYSSSHPWAIIPAVQLVACTVSVLDVYIDVSAETRLPVSYPSPPATAEWKNWTWASNDSTVFDQKAAVASTISWFSSLSSASSSEYDGGAPAVFLLQDANVTDEASAPIVIEPGAAVDTSTEALVLKLETLTQNLSTTSVPVTVFDQFLCEDLELVQNQQPRANITLADLNMSIGRALAAIYWYGRNYNYSDVHNTNPFRDVSVNASLDGQTGHGEATVNITVLRARFDLSLTPIIVGLVSSTILLALSFILIRAPHAWEETSKYSDVRLDSTGVLSIAWLLGHQPLDAVANPSSEDLRRAGMHQLHIGDSARERIRFASSRSLSHTGVGDGKDEDTL